MPNEAEMCGMEIEELSESYVVHCYFADRGDAASQVQAAASRNR